MARKLAEFSLLVALAASVLPLAAQPLPPADLSDLHGQIKSAEPAHTAAGGESTTAVQPSPKDELPEIVPGVLQEERAALLRKILLAKQQGCGIASYLAAFNQLQNDVKGGQPEGPVGHRLEALSSALDEQISRSHVLKTQQLPPVRHAAAAAYGGPAGGGRSSGRGGLDEVMQKYGGQLPPDVNKEALLKRLSEQNGGKNLNTDDLLRQLSSDPRAKAVLEKLKSGN